MDLRERRRQATRHDIADAALRLFEERGLAGTTVDDIAAAAGISPRTFFRIARTKEESVLVVNLDLLDAVTTQLDERGWGEDPLLSLEEAYGAVLASYRGDDDGHLDRLTRVRRLIVAEPPLLAAALRVDAEMGRTISARLAEHLGMSPDAMEPRAVVELAGMTVRLAFDDWATRLDAGDATADPLESYERAKAAMRAAR